MAQGGLDKAVGALAAAGGIAHAAFFMMFAWRTHAHEGWTAWLNVLWAGLAAVGFGSNFAGWALIKHGGRGKTKKLGVWGVALSMALAALLLVVASFGSS